jgi:hypothetical protein
MGEPRNEGRVLGEIIVDGVLYKLLIRGLCAMGRLF